MSAIEGHMGTILNIIFLIVLVTWLLVSEQLDKKYIADTKEPVCQTDQMNRSVSSTNSLLFWVKVLVVIQGFTLLFSMLSYFKY